MGAAFAIATADADQLLHDPARGRAVGSSAETRSGERIEQAGRVIQFDDRERRMVAWMNAAKSDDRVAYDNLVRAAVPFIKMVARKQGVPADFVDDVVQETLLAVHRNRREYDPSRPFTAWLRTIVQRRAIDMMRRRGRTAMREVHAPIAYENHADPTHNPADEAERGDRKGLLAIMAALLPSKQREAVEQLALDGKSLADAAANTGQTPGALTVNLHRALSTLRARFGNEKKSSDRDSFSRASSVGIVETNFGHDFSNVEHAFVKTCM